MVGLVIVSHSRELSNALANLVKQVSSLDVSIAVAVGIGEDRKEFGTGAVENHQIQISATGPEAESALTALKKLVDDNFVESTAPETVSASEKVSQPEISPAEGGSFRAVPISEGIALGPLYRYQPQPPSISTEPAQSPDAEAQRLDRALDVVRNNILQQSKQLKTTVGESEAAIFDAHLLILQDPDLLAQSRQNVFEHHQNAEMAWHEAAERVVASYRELEDVYLKQRAADVKDVENQVLFALAEKTPPRQLYLKSQ